MLENMGRYRITSKLGEGGMGVVYAAYDERLGRPVALKMIRKAVADDRSRERLWREGRAAASLNHPNICQVYEIGEENGELFLAMELLKGESLAAKLVQGPLSSAGERRRVLGQLICSCRGQSETLLRDYCEVPGQLFSSHLRGHYFHSI